MTVSYMIFSLHVVLPIMSGITNICEYLAHTRVDLLLLNIHMMAKLTGSTMRVVSNPFVTSVQLMVIHPNACSISVGAFSNPYL